MPNPSVLRIFSYLISKKYRTKLSRISIPVLGLEVYYTKLYKYTLDKRIMKVVLAAHAKTQDVPIRQFDSLVSGKQVVANLYDSAGALLESVTLCPVLRQSRESTLEGAYHELGMTPKSTESPIPAPLSHIPAWMGFISSLKDDGRSMYYLPDCRLDYTGSVKVLGVHPKSIKTRICISEVTVPASGDDDARSEDIKVDEEVAVEIDKSFQRSTSSVEKTIRDDRILLLNYRETFASTTFTLPMVYDGRLINYAPYQGRVEYQGVTLTSEQVYQLNTVWYFVLTCLQCSGRSITDYYNTRTAYAMSADYESQMTEQYKQMLSRFGYAEGSGYLQGFDANRILGSLAYKLFYQSSILSLDHWKALTDAGCNVYAITSVIVHQIGQHLNVPPNVFLFGYVLDQIAAQLFDTSTKPKSKDIYHSSLEELKDALSLIPELIHVKLPVFGVQDNNQPRLKVLSLGNDSKPYMLHYKFRELIYSYPSYLAKFNIADDVKSEHCIMGLDSSNRESGLHFLHAFVSPHTFTATCFYDSSSGDHTSWRTDNVKKQVRTFSYVVTAQAMPLITSVTSSTTVLPSAYDMEGLYLYPESIFAYLSTKGIFNGQIAISRKRGKSTDEEGVWIQSFFRSRVQGPIAGVLCTLRSGKQVPIFRLPFNLTGDELLKISEATEEERTALRGFLRFTPSGYSKTVGELLLTHRDIETRAEWSTGITKADMIALLFSFQRTGGQPLSVILQPYVIDDQSVRISLPTDLFLGSTDSKVKTTDYRLIHKKDSKTTWSQIKDYIWELLGLKPADPVNALTASDAAGAQSGLFASNATIDLNRTRRSVITFDLDDPDIDLYGAKRDAFVL